MVRGCADKPDAVMLENVRGILDKVFDEYRAKIVSDLKKLGYVADWRLLNASDYGVPQFRPRVGLVALRESRVQHFSWPTPSSVAGQTVGESLFDLMASNGWLGTKSWRERAETIAPTLVGGSKKHGGPDLGPARAKKA
jgi:DNA (cytosine-5)-methyltransferase 1